MIKLIGLYKSDSINMQVAFIPVNLEDFVCVFLRELCSSSIACHWSLFYIRQSVSKKFQVSIVFVGAKYVYEFVGYRNLKCGGWRE